MRKIYTLFQALFNSVPEQTAGQSYTQSPHAKPASKDHKNVLCLTMLKPQR
jgi:hypothetical protein